MYADKSTARASVINRKLINLTETEVICQNMVTFIGKCIG